MNSRVHIDVEKPLITPPPTVLPVGTVGTLGTTNDINRLEETAGRNSSRNSRNNNDINRLEGTDGQNRSEQAERARDFTQVGPRSEEPEAELDADEPVLAPPPIPLAGLLAAAQGRPSAAVAQRSIPRSDCPAEWIYGVIRLQSMPPLAGFTSARWRRICLDCAGLLDGWGAEMHRLGWRAEDAFGVHPAVPDRGYAQMGLGVLLTGGRVVEITKIGACIETRSGVRQSFVRPLIAGVAVPIWRHA